MFLFEEIKVRFLMLAINYNLMVTFIILSGEYYTYTCGTMSRIFLNYINYLILATGY